MTLKKLQGRKEVEKSANSQGNVGLHCLLVIVDISTLWLEMRWEPEFVKREGSRERETGEVEVKQADKGERGKRRAQGSSKISQRRQI